MLSQTVPVSVVSPTVMVCSLPPGSSSAYKCSADLIRCVSCTTQRRVGCVSPELRSRHNRHGRCDADAGCGHQRGVPLDHAGVGGACNGRHCASDRMGIDDQCR